MQAVSETRPSPTSAPSLYGSVLGSAAVTRHASRATFACASRHASRRRGDSRKGHGDEEVLKAFGGLVHALCVDM